MDISLLEINPDTGAIKLKLGSKQVKGLTKLVQIVVLSLLNVPGKDVLEPEKGGGIPELIGMNFDPTDLTEILGELTRKIRKTETEIMRDQVGLNITSDEKLKEIKIIKVQQGDSLDEISARIRVINELGQQSDVVI